jgi:hypothetical protein
LRDRTTDTVKDAVSQVKSKTRQVTSGVLGKNHEITNHGNEAFDDQYTTDVNQTFHSRRNTVQGP